MTEMINWYELLDKIKKTIHEMEADPVAYGLATDLSIDYEKSPELADNAAELRKIYKELLDIRDSCETEIRRSEAKIKRALDEQA